MRTNEDSIYFGREKMHEATTRVKRQEINTRDALCLESVFMYCWSFNLNLHSSNHRFTDPQIHTRKFRGSSEDRQQQLWFKRFSMGNLGHAGMVQFFDSHVCGKSIFAVYG